MVWLRLGLPPNLAKSHYCSLQLTVGAPLMSSSPSVKAKPQEDLAERTIDCGIEESFVSEFNNLPPHTYFNVCAVIRVEETPQKGASPCRKIIKQCLLSSAPYVRYEDRSVFPLTLTLVFMALSIACLTMLYCILKRHKEDSRQSVFIHTSTVSPLMGC